MSDIQDLLKKLHSFDAFTIPPTEDEDVDDTQLDLADLDFTILPQEYIQFLYQTDGLSWEGIEFFGSCEVEDEALDYVLPDIVSANEEYDEYKKIGKRLILGRADEDLFAYQPNPKSYEILDSNTMEVKSTFKTFEALFQTVIHDAIAQFVS
jgi:hypothetical protein